MEGVGIMKKISIITNFLILFSVTCFFNSYLFSAEKSFGLYKNNIYGFSILLPEGWSRTELQRPETVIWATNESQCMILIQSFELPNGHKNLTLQELSDTQIQNIMKETFNKISQTTSNGLTNATFHSAGATTINNKKAGWFLMSALDTTIPPKGVLKRLKYYTVFHKGKSYQIGTSAPKDKYNICESSFNICVKSFKFIKD